MASRPLSILVSAKGAAQAARDIGKVDSKVKGLNTGLGRFTSSLRGGAGSALTTFSGRLKGLGTAALGIFGVGGILGAGKLFTDSISKAKEFGEATERIAAVTGLAAAEASKLVDTLDYFNIAGDTAEKLAGMAAKNVDRLGGSAKKATAFEKDYGLKITDSSGALLDFNEQLLASADFFNNKSIPASKKAAALSKLYGRSWQDLIPVLLQGRKGIEKAQKDAMTLSEADLEALRKNREATRAWDDALGDLQTRIGIDFLPTLTEMATGLTDLVTKHGSEIRDFFKNALTTGKNLAGTAFDAVRGIADVWNGIPAPIRDLLVKGFVADRTIKFLFGFSVTGLVTDLAGGVAKGLGSVLVQQGIGKAFVQPVFVTNMGAGMGGPGVMPGNKGGILGLLGGLTLVGFLAAAASEYSDEITQFGIDLRKQLVPNLPVISPKDVEWPFGPKNTPTILPEIFGGNGLLGGTGSKTTPGMTTPAASSRQSYEAAQTRQKLDGVRNSMNRQGDRIVSALNRLDMQVTVPVTVRFSGSGATKQTGTTLVRIGGNAAAGALAGM